MLVPFTQWVFDPRFGLHLCLGLSSLIIIGQYLKNIFELPRPPSPPVWTPGGAGNQLHDYGLPSTHALSSFLIAIYSFLYFYYDPYADDFCLFSPKNHFSWGIGLFLAILWFTFISFSRVYNGYHGPLDIFAALFLAAIYVFFPLLLDSSFF